MNLAEDKIIFQRTRDTGEVVTTTFRFIRENFRVLLMGALFFMLPFFVVGSIFFITAFNRVFMNMGLDSPNPFGSVNPGASIFFMFLGFIFNSAGFVMQITYVNEIIKYVALHPDGPKPTVNDIWKETRKKFWMNILHTIVWLIMVITGGFASSIAYFILLPLFLVAGAAPSIVTGVIIFIAVFILMFLIVSYLYSITMPIFFIYTYEKINIFNAIGRTLSLMHMRKENFWGAIFSNAICMFIYIILSMNFVLPLQILKEVAGSIGGTTEDILSHPIIKLLSIIGMILTLFLQFFFLNLPLINSAIKYFDWVERVDGKGLIERIKTIGQNKDFDPGMYEESY